VPDIEIIYERMEIYGLLGQILVLLFLLLLPWRVDGGCVENEPPQVLRLGFMMSARYITAVTLPMLVESYWISVLMVKLVTWLPWRNWWDFVAVACLQGIRRIGR
jgi:hypothetical protein